MQLKISLYFAQVLGGLYCLSINTYIIWLYVCILGVAYHHLVSHMHLLNNYLNNLRRTLFSRQEGWFRA